MWSKGMRPPMTPEEKKLRKSIANRKYSQKVREKYIKGYGASAFVAEKLQLSFSKLIMLVVAVAKSVTPQAKEWP
jgi:hypothetical protein